jgi:hypothetical protein
MSLILFVDPSSRVETYIKMLQEGSNGKISCKHFREVDSAWEFIQDHQEITGIIAEIILDTGQLFAKEPRANNGMNTGLLLLEKIRSTGSDCPVAFVSSFGSAQAHPALSRKVEEGDCLYYYGFNWPPRNLLAVLADQWGLPYNGELVALA